MHGWGVHDGGVYGGVVIALHCIVLYIEAFLELIFPLVAKTLIALILNP